MKKNIIVTGARKGLGLTICRRLAEEGYNVIAIARADSPELNALCGGGSVFLELFDLINIEEMHSFVLALTKKYGRIYGLINNAAVGGDGVLATMHEVDISNTIKINLTSPIVLTKYVARSMLLAGEGRIVNISSIIAATGFSGLSVYGATKAGLHGFTKSLSRELGKTGITVNCVAPGYLETDMTKGLSQEKLASIRRRSPSGRLASLESVTAAVLFLLSAEAASVNGTSITVDAGSTA